MSAVKVAVVESMSVSGPMWSVQLLSRWVAPYGLVAYDDGYPTETDAKKAAKLWRELLKGAP